jgi:hypothetical protein
MNVLTTFGENSETRNTLLIFVYNHVAASQREHIVRYDIFRCRHKHFIKIPPVVSA